MFWLVQNQKNRMTLLGVTGYLSHVVYILATIKKELHSKRENTELGCRLQCLWGGLFCVTTSLLIFDVLLTQALSWESVHHVLSKLWSSCNLLQHVQLWDLLVHTQPLHCFLRHPDDTHGWVGSTNSACGCLGFPSTLMQHTESFLFPRNWKSFRWNSSAGTSHPIQPSACSRLFFLLCGWTLSP